MLTLEDLRRWQDKIEGYARGYGLDFFQQVFELVDYRQLNEIAAYGGFPVRYPHWSHGMDFDRLNKGYQYGLQKIYEMVINNDPCYAYLMKENAIVDQKLVMCHVYGHNDFFKNNIWFSRTNRKMIDEIANHASRIRRYIDLHGLEEVEDFLDICLSIDRLIDVHGQFIERPRPGFEAEEETTDARPPDFRFEAKPYMDTFINPEEVIERQRRAYEESRRQEKKFPARPERDVLLFLMHFAPLEPWQRDILGMVRDESYYFAPQWQTKVMNEGWATYWHSRMMTEKVMDDSEVVDFADHHSGTVGGQGFNPYKIGLYLFRDIEDRWNRGRHGPEYEACTSFEERRSWDEQKGEGRDKIFEVRKIHNDVTFIDTFLTEEFCLENRLFVYQYDLDKDQYVIASREFAKIKQHLLAQLTNGGQPLISIVDADHGGNRELYLRHAYEGIPLDLLHARATLQNLYRIWKRPVMIETVYQDKPILLRCEGEETEVLELEAAGDS